MSKYKCISDINRQCIHIPNGIGCSKLCYDSYQQGKADAVDEAINFFKKEFEKKNDSKRNFALSIVINENIYEILEDLKEQNEQNKK